MFHLVRFLEPDYVAGTGYAVKHPVLAIKQLCYGGNGGDYSLPLETHRVFTNR